MLLFREWGRSEAAASREERWVVVVVVAEAGWPHSMAAEDRSPSHRGGSELRCGRRSYDDRRRPLLQMIRRNS